MDIVEKKIISIGGGGFTHQTYKFLDEFVINQIIDRKIKFGFLPTASKDNLNKIKVYYEELKKYNLELSHFELCSKTKGFSNWIMDQDIIGQLFHPLQLPHMLNLQIQPKGLLL